MTRMRSPKPDLKEKPRLLWGVGSGKRGSVDRELMNLSRPRLTLSGTYTSLRGHIRVSEAEF